METDKTRGFSEYLGVGESAIPDLDVLDPPGRVRAHLRSGFRVSGSGFVFLVSCFECVVWSFRYGVGGRVFVCNIIFRVSGVTEPSERKKRRSVMSGRSESTVFGCMVSGIKIRQYMVWGIEFREYMVQGFGYGDSGMRFGVSGMRFRFRV